MKNKSVSNLASFQVVLCSSSKDALFVYLQFLKSIFFRVKSTKFSSICLPKKKSLFTLLKSPHVNKKAKEHFSIVNYKILLTFKDIDFVFMKYLLLDKPKLISVKIVI